MKIYKSYFIKKRRTIVTALTGLLFSSCSSILFSPYTSEDQTLNLLKSERISADSMLYLKNEYNNYRTFMRTRYKDEDGYTHVAKLTGFRFSTDDLDSIINNNAVKDASGKPVRPDEVIIYFGKLSTFRYHLRHRPVIHVIAVGSKKDTLMIPASTSDKANALKSSIFDKADPCPGPHCPK